MQDSNFQVWANLNSPHMDLAPIVPENIMLAENEGNNY